MYHNTRCTIKLYNYSTNHVYLHRFSRLRFCVCILNAFNFQTDFNLRLKQKRDVRFICKHVWCHLHRILSLNQVINHPGKQAQFHGFNQRFWKHWFWIKLNPPNAHRSQFLKLGKRKTWIFGSCQMHFKFLSQFREVLNAFECFLTQVQTHLPKCIWHMKINVICTDSSDQILVNTGPSCGVKERL